MVIKNITITIILLLIYLNKASCETYKWSFAGFFGYYDKAQLQRGLKIYKNVCSNCHSIRYVAFDALHDLGYNNEQINYLKTHYKANYFPVPFKNDDEARDANNGSIPPDLSNIVKQRSNISISGTNGADYIVNLLIGYENSASHQQNLTYYNPNFYNGNYINMPPPLSDGIIEYKDGTEQTTMQYSKDIAAFLYWCSNPKLSSQHETGFCIISFLIVLSILLYKLKTEYDKDLSEKDKLGE